MRKKHYPLVWYTLTTFIVQTSRLGPAVHTLGLKSLVQIYSLRFQLLLFVDRRLGKRRFCHTVLPPALCASQTNRLHSERGGTQNLQVQGSKSSGIRDVYSRHNSAKSSWQMEMPARDQQGCGQGILSLGLSVWRDQLNHVVGPVGTFHSFVGMSLFKRNLK